MNRERITTNEPELGKSLTRLLVVRSKEKKNVNEESRVAKVEMAKSLLMMKKVVNFFFFFFEI